MEPTRVYLTVDTECAEERVESERPIPPQGYELRVWGRFRNRSDALGITLFDHVLAENGLKATFFVEALGSYFFGLDGLREVCTYLKGRGHDVQLHAHPIQRNAAYRTKEDAPASDDFADYDVEAQATMLRDGIAILAKCGVPREEVVAFRAGNCAASAATWDAMRKAGLTLSSSCDVTRPRCRLPTNDARAGVFAAGEDVWELPIGAFVAPRGGARSLRVGEVSFDEMRAALLAARARGVGDVCVVAQSSDFARVDSVAERTGRVDRLTFRRFEQLCRFLRDQERDFTVDTVRALASRL
jgi:hypothetical protein